MKSQYVFLILCLALLISVSVYADTSKQTLEIPKDTDYLSISSLKPHVSIYLDTMGVRSFESISTSDQLFTPAGDQYPRLGLFDGVVWLKIELKNMSDNEDYLLKLEHAKIDTLQVYLSGAEGLTYFETGDDFHFSQRPILHPQFSFPLALKKGHTYTCYIKIVSASVIRFPLVIHSVNNALNSGSEFAIGAFFGALLLVVVFGNLAFFFTRASIYFRYAQYVFFKALFFSSHSGHAFQWIYPKWPGANPFMAHVGAIGGLFFGCLFAISLKNVKSHSVRLYNIYKVFIGWLVVIALVMLFHTSLGAQLLVYTFSFYFFLFIWTAVFVWKKGDTATVFFIPAWIAYFISSSLFFLKNKAILANNFWTDNSFYFASLVEITIFSFMLSYRYGRTIMKKKELEIVQKQKELDLINERIKVQNLQSQKELKDRQLLSASLMNQQQDELLNSLKSIDSNEHLRKRVNSILVSKNMHVNNWENFKFIFEEVHPDFFKRVIAIYPNLTSNDLRHLAYTKINLQVKEIASFSGVSIQAVKMARNRLKKKLSTNDSLFDVVNRL